MSDLDRGEILPLRALRQVVNELMEAGWDPDPILFEVSHAIDDAEKELKAKGERV